MNRTFIVAILLVAAVPVCAHAQNPKVSTGDAQKAVTIISGDKIKTQAYCDIHKLAQQLVEAHEKKTAKRSINCSRKLKHWKKPWVPNMSH